MVWEKYLVAYAQSKSVPVWHFDIQMHGILLEES